MTRLARISLGSNLGERAEILRSALAELDRTEGLSVRSVSRFYETLPVGGPEAQGRFLNAAAELATDLSAVETLHELRRVERLLGRDRRIRWGERTIDLDLLLVDQEEVASEELELPHPRMSFRRFVLDPLAEIAPAAVEPLTGLTISELRRNLDRRPKAIARFGFESLQSSVEERLRRIGWALSLNPADATFLLVDMRRADLNLPASQRWKRTRGAYRELAGYPKPPAPVYWCEVEHWDEFEATCRGLSDD